MADPVTTSLDVMGGDIGPMQVLPGADIALTRRPDIRYRLFGDEKVVQAAMREYIDAGVEIPIVMPLPWGEDRLAVVRDTMQAVAGA